MICRICIICWFLCNSFFFIVLSSINKTWRWIDLLLVLLLQSCAPAGKFMSSQLYQCINLWYSLWMCSNTFIIQCSCYCITKASVIISFRFYCYSFVFDPFFPVCHGWGLLYELFCTLHTQNQTKINYLSLFIKDLGIFTKKN